MTKTLSREEAKQITRRGLLEGAAELLAERGDANLTASAVARAAGVAQPTFYVHFRDLDDLLKTLAEEKLGNLREALHEARERVRLGQGIDAVRATFRLPLETLVGHGALFRLYLQAAHQPESPLGEAARALARELHADLVEDLVALGLPSATPAERERIAILAEALIAQTEALGLAILEGRYASVETVVDVLSELALAALETLRPSP